MAFDIALARAEELELEPSARVHRMSGHRDAIAIVLSCSCGWTRKIFRKNALARASKDSRPSWVIRQSPRARRNFMLPVYPGG